MKHLMSLIVTGVVFGFGFYTGKQAAMVPQNDLSKHDQVSGLLKQSNVPVTDIKAKADIFEKHDLMSAALPPLYSFNIQHESPTTPPLPKTSEKPNFEDIREQEKLRDELISSLKKNGAHEEDIQVLFDSINATLEDSLKENSPPSFPDSNELLSEKEMSNELLASLRIVGVSEEQIHAMAESMSASNEVRMEQHGIIKDALPQQ
jgi:hypothetical protein